MLKDPTYCSSGNEWRYPEWTIVGFVTSLVSTVVKIYYISKNNEIVK